MLHYEMHCFFERYFFAFHCIFLNCFFERVIVCTCIGIQCSASEWPLELGGGKTLEVGKIQFKPFTHGTAPCGGRVGDLCAKEGQSVRGTLLTCR